LEEWGKSMEDRIDAWMYAGIGNCSDPLLGPYENLGIAGANIAVTLAVSAALAELAAAEAGAAGMADAAEAATSAAQEGTTVYRVFGGEARGLGYYYTTMNPANVPNYRAAAGLFPRNSGSFVLEGTLTNTNGVMLRTAVPGPGGIGGGLPEVFVPHPGTQIVIRAVSGVNPSF